MKIRTWQPTAGGSGPQGGPGGFTIIELLAVLAIIAVLTAVALPSLKGFRANQTATATRQLLDGLARGRQLALSQRTTVYMVFVPAGFWNDGSFNPPMNLPLATTTNLFGKQRVGYNFLTLRSLGDQPGRPTARYLDEWKTLPPGSFIPAQKFDLSPNNYLNILSNNQPIYTIYGFQTNNIFPFPIGQANPGPNNRWAMLPYVAFDYMGRLVPGRDEIIPLAKGSVQFANDPTTKSPVAALPSFLEQPPGDWTNSYNLVYIDWLTGRARVVHQEIQ